MGSSIRAWRCTCSPRPSSATAIPLASTYRSAEIATCSVCYLQKNPRDLDYVDWKKAIPAEVISAVTGLSICKKCFPGGDGEAAVPICFTCRAALDRGRVPIAAYTSLSDGVFVKKNHQVNIMGKLQGRFNWGKLERVIKQVLRNRSLSENALL